MMVGNPIPDESAEEHVTGRAVFTDDCLGRFPNLLHAWPVVSPFPHARVRRIDPSPALASPEVEAVLTAADLPGANDVGDPAGKEPLFPEEVCYHRQPVAWVLAESAAAARRGAEAVAVHYKPLPALLTLDEARAAASFHCGPVRLGRGEAQRAFERSPKRLEGSLLLGGQEHFALETQAALAWREPSGDLAVLSATQHPAQTQEVVARVLGLPLHRVTVECPRMGGGFGGKEVQAAPYAAIAALGCWRTGRPVRVRLPRWLDMALTGKRHPFLGRFRAGFDLDGRLHCILLELFADGGWSLDLSEAVLRRALLHIDNLYWIPAFEAIGYVCRTHKTSQTAFRGFGAPQAVALIEEVMTRIAQTLDLPGPQVRERNFYRPGQRTHYGQKVEGAERILRIWETLQAESRFRERAIEIEKANRLQPDRKRGIALMGAKYGIAFTQRFLNQAGALVLLYRDGSAQVNHGGTEMGQGLQTKIRQIAASLLGLPWQAVRVMPARTDKIPNSSPTAASSGCDLNGAAVADACRTLRRRLLPVASDLLEAPSGSLSFGQGRAWVRDRAERALPIARIVEESYRRRIPLFAYGSASTPGLSFDWGRGRGSPFRYFAFGAAVSE
ncbi:partial xanthine dehydrogenase large subunit, partial [Methylacidimicrobium cyclopophantes]